MMTDSVMTQAQLTLISHKLDLCSSNARSFIIRLYTAAEIFLIFFIAMVTHFTSIMYNITVMMNPVNRVPVITAANSIIYKKRYCL